MAISRSALEFMQRHGMERLQVPRPRLSVMDLRVHTIPALHPQLAQEVLESYEGLPPPDRGEARPWPNQMVIDGDVG